MQAFGARGPPAAAGLRRLRQLGNVFIAPRGGGPDTAKTLAFDRPALFLSDSVSSRYGLLEQHITNLELA